MRILFITIIFILPLLVGEGWSEVKAQDRHKLDSFLYVYNNAKHDTTRIKTYFNIGDVYEYFIPDSAMFYYQKAVDLADKSLSAHSSNFTQTADVLVSLKAKSIRYIGIIHSTQGNYDKAVANYLKSLKIYRKLDRFNPENVEWKNGMAACYNNIGIVHENQGSYDNAIEYYLKSLKIDEETGNTKGMASSYNNIGIVHENQGSYDNAIEYYLKALRINEEMGNKQLMSSNYHNIGGVHYYQGSYDNAIEYYLKSLKIDEEIGAKKGMSMCYNNIGIVHQNQGSYNKAIEYYLKALKINEEMGNKQLMSSNYHNIGIVHENQGSYDNAIEYYLIALKINEEIGDKKGMSGSYNDIGLVYKEQGLYDKAIEYYLKSLKIKEETRDKNGISVVYGNIASLNYSLADSIALSEKQRTNYLNKAVEYGNKAYSLALEIDAVPQQNNAAAHLQRAYTKLGRYKEAIKYAEIFITTQDSMFSEEKTKALAEMGAKYETEKKQLQIEKMEKQKELDNKTIEAQEAENRKQLIIIISAIAGFIIVLIFSIIVFRMFSQKRKSNILLAEQKAEIEEKNKDIMDSITYAKRIQSAILPPSKIVKEYLKESFILYKPKDIVAGDFYWLEHKEGKILFAAADCTGHGVPGAMVSVVCNNGLNRSVREYGLTDPGQILDKTREIVIQEFEKSDEEVKDGMDIALCSLEFPSPKERDGRVRLQYAGANNPLWIINPNRKEWPKEVLPFGEDLGGAEIKANKQPIGKFDNPLPYTTHSFELEKGDSIYIFSDGYVDQFGGEKGKKFKAKAFRELLLGMQDKAMEEQRLLIDDIFENWRGELEQIDDVCIIGVRI